MAKGYIEPKGAVETFLSELKRVLNNKNSKLILLGREDKEEQYTTIYCLNYLMYDEEDVKNELKNLTVDLYIETCNDERNKKSNRYYIFDKTINGKEIYIKIKIQSYDNNEVLCMSFHFAEYSNNRFPYK